MEAPVSELLIAGGTVVTADRMQVSRHPRFATDASRRSGRT